jgi:hypothetical protein
MNRFRRTVVVLAACAGLVVGSAAHTTAAARDPRVTACGIDSAARVAAVIDLAHAKDVWTRLPALGRSPELEVDDPASLVVYEGDVPAPAMHVGMGQMRPSSLHNAICVLDASGAPTIYENVSRAGFRVP